ncbi:hypothetical protein SKAU_G00283940 [Synaphobranchus kaupii]|uniref:Taperin n=1 Tax=Synaphobranchus kaupii TaxID=118154 RepID=A0A9Q1EXU4_SYNKA|nr:hypothetical protein SKAU_G00283940 [Synaphobranchus kaupii]
MLFSLRELVQWLGFATFELFLHLGALLAFSVLLALRSDLLASGMSWWLVFVPLFAADGLSTYFTAIVSIRLYQEVRAAACSSAAPLGADGSQPEAGVRGAAVPEAGRAGAGSRPVVWPHRLAPLHPVAAAHDPRLPRQLRTGCSVGPSPPRTLHASGERVDARQWADRQPPNVSGSPTLCQSGPEAMQQVADCTMDSTHWLLNALANTPPAAAPVHGVGSLEHHLPNSGDHPLPPAMSGGEVRVLHREAGQESPRMPAWKREILERRKAKGSGAGAGAAEPSSSAAATTRVNGEVTGDSGASKNKESISSASSNRNYTITPASQHFAGKHGSASASPELSPVKSNKDPWITNDTLDADITGRGRGGEESLVLQDSLGPLQENPFIKLEKERKRRQDRESAARPVQHILELYGSVPGIRTIRAENIIIIESDPDYFSDGSGIKTGAKLNGTVGSYSSLSDLVDRRGSAVTEIRAKEVVIYDSALSKSEENLSTLGRPGSEAALDLGRSQGRVSRMLQKFDRNYGKLQPKSRSTENLLDLETCPVRSRPMPRPKPQPDQVPKSMTPPLYRSPAHSPDRSESGPVFQSSQSSKPLSDAALEGHESGGSPAGSPQSVSSYRQRFEKPVGHSVRLNPREASEGLQMRPLRLRDGHAAESSCSPKVPCSPERRCAGALSPTASSPPQSPPSPRFEIRPSPRPDLSALPAGDIQARALANLRLQSRNSFTVIPRPQRVLEPPATAVPTPSTASLPMPRTAKKQEPETAAGLAKTEPPKLDTPLASVSPLPPSEPPVDTSSKGAPPELDTPVAADRLPITNIDDIEVEPRQAGLSPMVQRRTGNTFTVVPKRRSDLQPSPPEPQPSPPDPQDAGHQTPSTPPQAPYAQLGSLLKKRYPAVDEIEVIGGYLSLGRSCLSKAGSSGKKLKISFNESVLASTFEYPSESSLWDSEEEDRDREEEEEDTQRGEEERGRERMLIPRASYTSSPTNGTNSSDLSSYTPKNSVDFSAWQGDKLDDPSFPGDSNSRGTELPPEEVMLTPADSSSLSDFSSEPALYF